MTTTTDPLPRIVGPHEGDRSRLGGCEDRFLVDGTDTSKRFSLVEQTVDPGTLAAPVHRHHDEDEYAYVLSGSMGMLLGTDEIVAAAGDLVFKPRDQWHTFWNPGNEPLVVLELISPAGIEVLFRSFAELEAEPDPELLAQMAARYGCDIAFDQTMALCSRHGIAFE